MSDSSHTASNINNDQSKNNYQSKNEDDVEKINANNSKSIVPLNDDFSTTQFIKEAFSYYKYYLKNYPVYTKSITSCTIAVLGEVLATYVKSVVRNEKFKIDYKRLGIFGLYGLTCTGPMLHFWYTLLEYIVVMKMNLSGKAKVAAKLAIDRLVWGPPFVLFTITFLQLLQTMSTKKTAAAIRNSYAAILYMNQKVWVPGQALNFGVIPVDYQVLFVNAVNVGWNTYLSMAN